MSVTISHKARFVCLDMFCVWLCFLQSHRLMASDKSGRGGHILLCMVFMLFNPQYRHDEEQENSWDLS